MSDHQSHWGEQGVSRWVGVGGAHDRDGLDQGLL